MYRYRITFTKESSLKYGPCEVCGQHVTEVYHQTEERTYKHGWTRQGCRDLFGHETCLIKERMV